MAHGDAQAIGRSRRYFDLVIVNSYPHESMAEAAASTQLDFPGRLVLNADELSRGRFGADRLLHAVRELTGAGLLDNHRKPVLRR